MAPETTIGPVVIRTSLIPGDVGSIVRLHGVLYAKEYGFDHTFEAYVAAPLAKLVQSPGANERIWLAERNGSLVGCVAIVASAPGVAQLRWFLVDPECRGVGLGKRLLFDAIEFSRSRGYRSIILWTVSGLPASASLYRFAGFAKVEEKPPATLWGVRVTEERYELALT
jgi:N-acetylglutamate synthase-like GNAT family acetyltransferase